MGKFCGNCGYQLRENLKFCPKCGQPVVRENKEESLLIKKQEVTQDLNREDKVSLLLYEFLGLNEPLEVDEINESLELHSINEDIQKKDNGVLYNETLFSIVTLVMLSLGCMYYVWLYAGESQEVGLWCFLCYIFINVAIWGIKILNSSLEMPLYVPIVSTVISSIALTMIHAVYERWTEWYIVAFSMLHIIQGGIWGCSAGGFYHFFKKKAEKKKAEEAGKIEKREKVRKILEKRAALEAEYDNLVNISDKRIKRYIQNSIELYEERNYEDAIVNIRKLLECFLYTKAEYNNVIFENEKELSIYNIIEYFKRNGERDEACKYHWIRKQCNSGAHVLDTAEEHYSEENVKEILDTMFWLLSSQTQIFNISEGREALENKMNVYFERSERYAVKNDYEDSLLNLRKSLECLFYGYMKYYHVICAFGHEMNLNGYIDMLCEKGYIDKKSKQVMHYIRAFGNKGAHISGVNISSKEINNLLKGMKGEIIKYGKKDTDNSKGYSYLEDGEEPEEMDEFYEDEEVVEVYGNRRVGNNRYRYNYDEEEYYIEDADDEQREPMPSELVDPVKYCDPVRMTDPYIQSCPPEEYFIKL